MEEIKTFSVEQLNEPMRVRERAARKFLEEERRSNVIGVGVGAKIRRGQITDEPALMVLVTQKVASSDLRDEDRIPEMLEDVKTDVIEVGYPQALHVMLPPTEARTARQDVLMTVYDGAGPAIGSSTRVAPVLPTEAIQRRPLEAPMQVAIQQLARRIRPVQGGWSVGHYQITAGTIATCVYDLLPGAGVNPPTFGIGIPPKFYILSNNHVLANSNEGHLGDAILQPGPFDGGTNPADKIASLSRFIPIQFAPQIPLAQQNNIVDAAIAEGNFDELDRSVYWNGDVRGWYRKSDVKVGTVVKKTGRTTSLTFGRILAIGATIDVSYPGSRVARFKDQIITTNMSAGGDSGSLVLNADDNKAVGLLFAGSSSTTIINQIENVRSLLRVELWP